MKASRRPRCRATHARTVRPVFWVASGRPRPMAGSFEVCGRWVSAPAAGVSPRRRRCGWQHALRQLGIGTDEFHFIAEDARGLLQDHVLSVWPPVCAPARPFRPRLSGVRPSSLGPAAVAAWAVALSPHDERTWRPGIPGRVACHLWRDRRCSCATRAPCAAPPAHRAPAPHLLAERDGLSRAVCGTRPGPR